MTMHGDGGSMPRYERETGAAERTFGALPVARGRAFARSWWGQAWLKALEDTALDGAQLALGRRCARAGAGGAVSVRPGRITAVVQDRDHTRHRSDVLVQQLSGVHWERLADLVADRAGHLAALLDHDLPPVLVEDASAAGIEPRSATGGTAAGGRFAGKAGSGCPRGRPRTIRRPRGRCCR